ncbi:hypothetical protein GYMLUDRAFT_48362 [Collybiopsis luxurians FD-317 M1]|uniref:F-box domain-containing protein n=1 Tax=Collybiopsis luxurians FD-317 M1 TaxID=944289 RepID=A0A0D0BY87_9AGAR|nr:hypothetical protein GYMLUDRAFT_48362 [Collybiopsis luxurians FD-317 M1]
MTRILLTTYLSNFHSLVCDQERRNLSQVCRQWHTAVLRTSRFWADITITRGSVNSTVPLGNFNPLQIPPDRAREVFPYVSTILDRSGVQPLRIYMNLETRDCLIPDLGLETELARLLPWTIAHSRILGGIILPHAARIQHLQIASIIYHPISVLLSSLAGQVMPLLEYADCTRKTLRLMEDEQPQDLPEFGFSCFESSAAVAPAPDLNTRLFPQLRFLSLSGVPQLWGQFIPRHRLVSLSLEDLPQGHRPTYLELKDLLHSQISLRRLRLGAATPAPDSSVGPGDKIVLPDLEELAFGFEVGPSSFFFIQHTEFPSLVSLDLKQIKDPDGNAYHIFRAIITFWGPSLRKISYLTLQHIDLSARAYMESLDDAELAFLEKSRPACFPIVMWLLSTCCSVKYLNLHYCDDYTLGCLAIPLYVLHKDPPGMFPCRDLEQLEIVRYGSESIIDFLRRYTFWLNLPNELVTPRRIKEMVVDVDPELGTLIKAVIKPNMAVEFRNLSLGPFLVQGVEGEVENLMDHVRA